MCLFVFWFCFNLVENWAWQDQIKGWTLWAWRSFPHLKILWFWVYEFIGRSIRRRSVKLSWESWWFQLLISPDMSWASPVPPSKISWKQIIYKNTKMSLNIPQIFSYMSELIWFMFQWKVALIFIWTVSSYSLRLTFSHNGLDYEKKIVCRMNFPANSVHKEQVRGHFGGKLGIFTWEWLHAAPGFMVMPSCCSGFPWTVMGNMFLGFAISILFGGRSQTRKWLTL